jgi:N-acetyl-alpha-D-muramate 1-phosphate uridylyltransferase
LKAQAIILAAGRGERMRPLTDATPKPLLPVRGKPLMQWHLEALARNGFTHSVVNTAWLGEQIPACFDANLLSQIGTQPVNNMREQLSKREQLRISYSHEAQDFGGALETAGGITRALPRLSDVFWVLAGDVYAPSFEFSRAAYEKFAASNMLAHLWLVPNPPHHPRGDFGLSSTGLALNSAAQQYTYSTIGLYKHAFFAPPFCNIPAGNPQGIKAPLVPLMRAAMDAGRVSAELFEGGWTDVGTPERLAQINAQPDNPSQDFTKRQQRGTDQHERGLELLRKAQGLDP